MDYNLPCSSVHGILGKNTGVGCHFLLQGIFLTQESNPGLPHCRQIFYEVVCTLFSVILKCALGIFQVVLLVMEKAMSTHSSTLAWNIPWTEEPGRLQSMGSLRVGHDWVMSLALFTFMPGRRKWQLTPVFLPGESQGRGSLMGCHLWGRTESDTTEAT